MKIDEHKMSVTPVRCCNHIHETLWSFISLLKRVGYIVISKHDKPIADIPVYHYKILSWTTIKAVIVQILFGFLCGGVTITSRQSLDNPIAYTLLFSGFFQAIVNLLTSWFRIKPTTKMLNGWNEIEKQFRQTFACHLCLPNLANEIRRIKIFGFWLPFAFLAIMGIIEFIENHPTFSENMLILSIRSFGFLTMIALTLSAQIFYFIICHVMSRLYKEIHNQILGHCFAGKKAKNIYTLDAKTILKWKGMFVILSKQMKYIGDFLSPADTVHIGVRVISLSISVYTVLQSLSGSSQDGSVPKEFTGYPITVSQVLLMAWVSLITNLGIGALQVHFAERIYTAYDRIVETLEELDTSNFEWHAMSEYKLLLRILDRKPCRLMYYGFVRIDRKLNVLIINASITYLIVLLQFKPL